MLIELFILIIFKQFMVKVGMYVDHKWMQDITELLQISAYDQKIITKAIEALLPTNSEKKENKDLKLSDSEMK